MNLKFKINNKTQGFTLIELLVVISIIGILAAISLVSFSTSQKQARDSVRKSDIHQYQTSLEGYANKNGSLYPSRPDASGADASGVLCADLAMTTCPVDSRFQSDNTFSYRYQSDGGASSGLPTSTKYVLWAKLESTTNYWVVCSSGKAGASPQSGFSVSGGVCPL